MAKKSGQEQGVAASNTLRHDARGCMQVIGKGRPTVQKESENAIILACSACHRGDYAHTGTGKAAARGAFCVHIDAKDRHPRILAAVTSSHGLTRTRTNHVATQTADHCQGGGWELR